MHLYAVFGGRLASELPFPELAPATAGTPDWTFRVGPVASHPQGELVHAEELTPSCTMRLTRADGVYRYNHSCTGTFEVSADGRVITWDGVPDAPMDTVRMDVLARVLLLCVSDDSVLCLHGSAVVADEGAIAFLGHSGAGKTTLAMAVARTGALHLSDDTLPISLDGVASVWAGDATVRLRDDTAAHFDTAAVERWRTADGKRVVVRPPLPAGSDRVPLAALYVVEPFRGNPSTVEAPTRRRLEGVDAVMTLIPHVRTAALLTGDRTAEMLDQVSRLVALVPVYGIRVPRGWEHLEHVAATLLSWHARAATPRSIAS